MGAVEVASLANAWRAPILPHDVLLPGNRFVTDRLWLGRQ